MMLWLELITIATGLIATLGGAIAWYRSTIRKEYASERDFNHIRREIQSLSQAIAHHADETEQQYQSLRDQLIINSQIMGEIRSYIYAKLGESTLGR